MDGINKIETEGFVDTRLEVWLIRFSGVYLDGLAIVLAHNRENAIALVSSDKKIQKSIGTLESVTTLKISGRTSKPGVVYWNDGDY